MDNKIFIYIGIVLVMFWLITPVPYCKITEKQIIVGDALYTIDEVSETKEIMATLLNVRGESMTPSIHDNSECLCIRKESYEVGDIVFYFAKINGQFQGICHRIVAITSEGIYPKGDNNDWADPIMPKESVVCSIPEVSRYHLLFG